MASVPPDLDSRIAHMPGVRKSVRVVAGEVAQRARANLAAHRETGASAIKVEHGAVDSLVVLDDEASLSIEFGREGFTRPDGRYVGPMEGLRVLGRAIGG